MDPGTAVGVISLGIQCCQGISSYYGSFCGQDTLVASTVSLVDGLNGIFVRLEEVIRQPNSNFDTDAVTLVKGTVASCKKLVDDLKNKLDRIRSDTPQSTLKGKARVVGRKVLFPFREDTLLTLKTIVQDLRGNLDLAAATLQLDTGEQINQGVDKLRVDVRGAHSIVQTIEGDVQGISTNISGIDGRIVDISKSVDDSRASLGHLSNNVDHIGRKIDMAEQKRADFQTESNYKSVIEWLSPVNCTQDQRVARKKREPNTGRWFLEGHEYEMWRTTTNSLLWVNGNRT